MIEHKYIPATYGLVSRNPSWPHQSGILMLTLSFIPQACTRLFRVYGEGRWRSYRHDGLNHEWETETDLLETALEEGFEGFIDTPRYPVCPWQQLYSAGRC